MSERTKANRRDFNSGSVLGNILYFSLSFLLSYFLQTLYGMADRRRASEVTGNTVTLFAGGPWR